MYRVSYLPGSTTLPTLANRAPTSGVAQVMVSRRNPCGKPTTRLGREASASQDTGPALDSPCSSRPVNPHGRHSRLAQMTTKLLTDLADRDPRAQPTT
jgi:hypothetical protein